MAGPGAGETPEDRDIDRRAYRGLSEAESTRAFGNPLSQERAPMVRDFTFTAVCEASQASRPSATIRRMSVGTETVARYRVDPPPTRSARFASHGAPISRLSRLPSAPSTGFASVVGDVMASVRLVLCLPFVETPPRT